MNYIKTLTSEAELLDKFFNTLRERRVVNQYVHYFGSGAEYYYDIPAANAIPDLQHDQEVYTAFMYKHLPKNEGDRYGFVSLGCGNAKREKNALLYLRAYAGHQLEYVGVDSSMGMLELAEIELRDTGIPCTLIAADIASDKLKDELSDLLPVAQGNVFAFLGSTLGNFQVDYTVDLIYDMMKVGDYLWVDVDIRLEKSPVDDRRLFEFFREYIQDEHNKKQKFLSLEKLGISPTSGDIYIEMQRDEALGALFFSYKFKANETIVVHYRGKQMRLLPNNSITLQVYRVYYPEDLISYFKQRNYEYIAHDVFNNEVGQFLFKKIA